ncbi:uncharacterized protein VNE69_07268 [Vairimorpha necatrix]|uniref:Uncharacterized protein n=1 Tax=Vairimorpha necatrix TaxID=6039 RepID=A0AAX4JEE9_9MICR
MNESKFVKKSKVVDDEKEKSNKIKLQEEESKEQDIKKDNLKKIIDKKQYSKKVNSKNVGEQKNFSKKDPKETEEVSNITEDSKIIKEQKISENSKNTLDPKILEVTDASNNGNIISCILNSNMDLINNTLQDIIYKDFICKFFTLELSINYFDLCEEFPLDMNIIIRSTDFNVELLKHIEFYIENFFKNLQYENIKALRNRQLFKIHLRHICPLVNLKRSIKEVYKLTNNQDVNDFSSYNFLILSGEIHRIKETRVLRSCFLECENILCQDKCYILKLEDVNYLAHESKKTFIHIVEDKYKTCLNCKSLLVENIKFRTYSTKYEHILNDDSYQIYIKSHKDLISKGFYVGFLQRRNNGKLQFNVNQSYEQNIENIKYKLRNTVTRDLQTHLLIVSSFIFKSIKSHCDIQDCILMIILNIFSFNNIRMLIFTTDSCYVRSCTVNFFKIKDLQVNIFYDMKSFRDVKGLCIRNYGDTKIQSVDMIFHLPINHLLDYSYEKSLLDFKINKKTVNLNENDQRNIQDLFIKFRKEYKRIIEPERLLNTLTSIYISILEYTEDSYLINDFILQHFVDKLL